MKFVQFLTLEGPAILEPGSAEVRTDCQPMLLRLPIDLSPHGRSKRDDLIG